MWMEIPVLMGSSEVQEHPRAPILKRTPSTGTSPYNIRHKRPEPPLGSHPQENPLYRNLPLQH
jgi:hypothetical protein